MVIIPEAQTVFIHIPRTGGTSLRSALLERFPKANDRYNKDRHYTVGEVPGHCKPWYKFTIIRNPWDCVRSHYGLCHRALDDPDYWEKWSSNAVGYAYKVAQRSFEEAVPILLNGVAPGGYYNTYCNRYVEAFRYEDDYLPTLCDRLGISGLDVPHLNESQIDLPDFSANSIKLVANRCWDDIERFGYKPPV